MDWKRFLSLKPRGWLLRNQVTFMNMHYYRGKTNTWPEYATHDVEKPPVHKQVLYTGLTLIPVFPDASKPNSNLLTC